MEGDTRRLQVDRFVLTEIDSVPHLEALLLLFNSRPKEWSVDEMGQSIYVRNEVAFKILESLVQRSLIAAAPRSSGTYFYNLVMKTETGCSKMSMRSTGRKWCASRL